MQLLLAALGARLAPPPTARRITATQERLGFGALETLPESLLRFYAVTDGAALPLLDVRIYSLAELERSGDGLVLTDAGHRVQLTGEVVHESGRYEDVFAWLVVLLGKCGLSAVAGTRVAGTPSVSKTAPPALILTDLLTRVCGCLECRGWKAIRTGAPFEVRVQGREAGSWYSVEPWLRRSSEPGIADRIADRFIRREQCRNASWRVRRDSESIETRDLREVVSWARPPWESLQVVCGVAHVSLSLFSGRDDHVASFEWHGGAWQARARLTPTQVRAALEHLLLRRDKWPGLDWTQMRQPPS